MYEVIFDDSIHGEIDEKFEDWDSAAEFWQSYADTESCVAGELSDCETGEVIWSFEAGEGQG